MISGLKSLSCTYMIFFRKLDSPGSGKFPLHDERRRTRQPNSMGPGKLAKTLFILITVLGISTLFLCYYQLSYSKLFHKTGYIDNLAKRIGIHTNKYAVIVDAGSTGSRIMAFSFHESIIDGSIKIESSIFVQSKPGLSSYAKDPKQGAESINSLLKKAKEFIPEEEWAVTPLALRATAGLRLLPPQQAQGLIYEVNQLFYKSPFLTNENSVSIMDGKDEGLYAWFTVNFLLDRIFGNPNKTVATLDLGGGSTQITFVPKNYDILKYALPEHLTEVSVSHHTLYLYSHSYLGLGLMIARKGILTHGLAGDVTDIHSDCINPIIKRNQWEYGGVKYFISGSKNPLKIKKKNNGGFYEVPVVSMKDCGAIVHDYIKSKKMYVPDLSGREIVIFSYFYDRAVESGIIDMVDDATATVKDFQKKANEVCHDPNADQPFACLDLTFISVLFTEGYGFTPDTKLKLVDKIDGQEVSWSLGAAVSILQNGL